MNVPARIEAARKSLRINQGEMGAELGLGRTMYHYVKTGTRELSNKALRELERLEAVVERRSEVESRIDGAVVLGAGQDGFEAVLWLKGLVEEMAGELSDTRSRADAALVRVNKVLAKVEKLERAAKVRKTKGK